MARQRLCRVVIILGILEQIIVTLPTFQPWPALDDR